MRSLLLFFPVLAHTLLAAPTPYSVARLVQEKDATAVAASLNEALGSRVPLVRATAARVITVRGATAFVPQLREKMESETDGTAARELIRAVGLLGVKEDVVAAAKVAARWPESMDDALANAVARRSGTNAIEMYGAVLRDTRMRNHLEFFRLALWGKPNLAGYAGSRMLAGDDEAGWRGLVGAFRDSNLALDPGLAVASLDAGAEGIRSATAWYLVRAHAPDPAAIPAVLKDKLARTGTEVSSNREDFGRELLRRMVGGERKNDERWLKFLEGEEADSLLGTDLAALQYLTDEEYAVHYNRCEVRTRECVLPEERDTSPTRPIPSQKVAPPAFSLPELLPAGLGDAIVSSARCDGVWLGVARATVDAAGRIQTLDLERIGMSSWCQRALDTLLRVSLADNTSIRSPFTDAVLLAHARKAPLCLDEASPHSGRTATFRIGGDVQAPEVKKRVEPQFPDSAITAMGEARNVLVILESVISRDGCVRSLQLVAQSPYPELNAAALFALSQWQFTPGYLDGEPVDVIFTLTINFRTR